jgi:hypothetical protein
MTPPKERMKKINIPVVIVLVIVLSAIVGLVALLGTADQLGTTIVGVILLVLGVLSSFSTKIKDAIDKSFAAYLRFVGWMIVFIVPITLINLLTGLVLSRLALVFQIIVFAVWGLLLAFGIKQIATEKNRERLFYGDRGLVPKIGSFAPVVYSFNLLMIAMMFFASITFVLVERAGVALNAPEGPIASYDALMSFYFWHFLEAVPLLKVNETLQWKQPLTYQAGPVGFVLLLFKLAVIVPVIAAFAWYWKKVSSHDEKSK